MMVYRIAHPKYAQDISGYGALLVPGRWHFKGVRVLYTAENSSLAFLEYLAHTEGITRRLNYQLVCLEVPDVEGSQLSVDQLPGDWKQNLLETRKIGSSWLKDGKTMHLKVPSVVNEDNFNFLFNPEHPDFKNIKIAYIKDIKFDVRL